MGTKSLEFFKRMTPAGPQNGNQGVLKKIPIKRKLCCLEDYVAVINENLLNNSK